MTLRACAAVFAVVAVMSPAVAIAESDGPIWPQFRGPGGAGVAAEDEHPPIELGPDKNVKWKIEAPSGASSPIIVGDLLVITAFDGGKLQTIAYRRNDGSEAWRTDAPYTKLEPYHKTEGSPAASTCATDGTRIVSYFGSCGLFCYDLAGKELWKYELPPANTLADFGTGVSPILVDGTVVLLRDEYKAPKIMALDAATGKLKWETARTSISGFGTPTAWDTPDGKQIAAPGYGKMIGYDLATGEERWFVAGMPASNCTTPVVADGQLYYAGWSPGGTGDTGFKMPTFDELLKDDANKDGVYSKEESLATPFKDFFDNQDPNKDGKIVREEWEGMLKFIANAKNSAFALKAGCKGDAADHVAWRETNGLPYVSSPILYGGQYVMVKDGGIVTAYDAKTGEEKYQKRCAASSGYYASPVAAAGNIYFTALKDGSVTVLKAGAEKPEIVVKNPPLGERVSATPAIADDTIYLRTAGHLYAFAAP